MKQARRRRSLLSLYHCPLALQITAIGVLLFLSFGLRSDCVGRGGFATDSLIELLNGAVILHIVHVTLGVLGSSFDLLLERNAFIWLRRAAY